MHMGVYFDWNYFFRDVQDVNTPPYRDWEPTANQSREVIKCGTQTFIVIK